MNRKLTQKELEQIREAMLWAQIVLEINLLESLNGASKPGWDKFKLAIAILDPK